MSNYNSIEKVISAELIRMNEDNLLANTICNTECTGEIKNRGDSVTFVGLTDPNVYDYDGNIRYDDIDDGAITLLIDQDKAFSFKVKDLEALRSTIGLEDNQTKRACYLLKNQVDSYVFSLYNEALFSLDPVTATPSNVLQTIAAMKQQLEEINVPDGRIWIVVPPFIKTKLMLAGIKFQINNGVNGTGAVAFTDELGCDIYVSNQLAKDESGATIMLAGSYSAIAYAEQVLETQVIEHLESSFDKAVRGRLVFGAKVIRPFELTYCPVTDGGNEI